MVIVRCPPEVTGADEWSTPVTVIVALSPSELVTAFRAAWVEHANKEGQKEWAELFSAVTDEILTPGRQLSVEAAYVRQSVDEFLRRFRSQIRCATDQTFVKAKYAAQITIAKDARESKSGVLEPAPADLFAFPENTAYRDKLLDLEEWSARASMPKRRAGTGRKPGPVPLLRWEALAIVRHAEIRKTKKRISNNGAALQVANDRDLKKHFRKTKYPEAKIRALLRRAKIQNLDMQALRSIAGV
jgi:hypothetical protein